MKPQEIAQEKANQIINQMSKVNQEVKHFAFDPLTLLAIISAIIQLFRLLEYCGYSPFQSRDVLKTPAFYHKFFMRRQIRKSFKNNGLPQYLKFRNEIETAILDTAKDMNIDEITVMLKG